MSYLILFLVVLSGVGVPIQGAVNARMKDAVQSPILSALISFLIGAVVLLGLSLVGFMGRGKISGIATAPWWAWTGGFYGALLVTMIIVGLPRLGALGVIVCTIFGQILASIVIDHFGLLGVPRTPVTAVRLIGTILVLAGVLLTRR